jgi:hypothetical protein
MDGVTKLVPVPNDVPPEGVLYQLRVAPGVTVVAPNVNVPVPHLVLGVVVDTTGLFTFTVLTPEYPDSPLLLQVIFNLKEVVTFIMPDMALAGMVCPTISTGVTKPSVEDCHW